MATAKISIPEKMDLAGLFSFAGELDYFGMHENLILSFDRKTFFAPFTMLFLACKLKSLRNSNPKLKFSCEGHEQHPYPAHMGFFRLLGVDHGKAVGEAWGNGNYLPITALTRAQLYEAPLDEYAEVQDLIQRHANKVALIIARDMAVNRDMYDALSFSIREVMRNVFEHSDTSTLYYCAQYWPASNKVEFAVADFGIGIRRGLGTNPNFRFQTDKEAIEYSLLPSVSGRTHLPRVSDTWFNSGYGLYMTNRLARNGGNFVLASGTTAIHLSRKTKTNHRTSFPGTIVRMNMDVRDIGSVQARLAEFRQDAAKIASQVKGSGNRPPSAMSLLLRRDYAE